MARKKEWTREKINETILPLIERGWTVIQIARFLSISRARFYKILEEEGLTIEDLRKGYI